VVTGPETLAQTVRELAPQTEVKVTGGASGTPSDKSAPLDLSTSKTELGYTPRFPLKEALRNYMEELWEEQRS
jgi:nucleoside-diphosphate-sugar epimerase